MPPAPTSVGEAVSGPRALAPWRIWTARGIAVAADAIQLGFIPAFGPGAASPLEDALDVGVAIALTLLVGWHWSFLPAIALELIPGVDLMPTWTGAALLATRGRLARGRG
jgi:hypothetical protein